MSILEFVAWHPFLTCSILVIIGIFVHDWIEAFRRKP